MVGVGTDLVEVARLSAVLERRPGVAERLFTPSELARCEGPGRVRSLAARFAAKEAVMKCLGAGIGAVGFGEIEIGGDRGEQPVVALSGRAEQRAEGLGIDELALSMAHDGGMATATAVASRRCTCDPS